MMKKSTVPKKRRTWRHYLLYFIMFCVLGGLLTMWIADEPLPTGVEGPEAEALADEMLNAVNDEAWQNVKLVSWEYPIQHHFIWDKESHCVRVSWPDYVALVNIDGQFGYVTRKGVPLDGTAKAEAIKTALEYWTNDSFWLNPISKLRDPGTKRSLVTMDDGTEALLVTYTSGGITPGDSYLWIPGENGYPAKWKFWVDIVPVGGVEFTWEDWVETTEGARISTTHKGLLLDISIENLQTGNKPSDFGYPDTLFDLVKTEQ